MRRRLLLVIVGTVTIALLVSGVGTYLLLRRDARSLTARDLARQAERMATRGGPLALRNVGLDAVVVVNDLDGASVFRVDADHERLTDGVEVAGSGMVVPDDVLARVGPAELRSLRDGGSLRGTVGDEAYAASARPSGSRLEVVVLTERVHVDLGRAVAWTLVSALAALLVAAAASAALARRLTRPLRAVTGVSGRIAAGDLGARVSPAEGVERGDEIGELARSINRMAEELGASREVERQFLLSVSHDLRTPLTSIRGFAEAIAEGTAPDQARAASVISAEARRLERLVRDLLELAKLDARRFELVLRTFDVTDLVTDAADGFIPTAEREGLRLELDAEPDLVATTDPDRLAQVLANLIENALKFAERTVTVTARRADTTGPGGRAAVEIGVRDDGPGIAPDDLPHVFDRMYSADRRRTRQIGSGLGLAIVRELVLAMGGTVDVATGSDGSTFTVRLPSAPARRPVLA